MEKSPPAQVDILITHGTLLTMNAEMKVIPDGAAAISGRRILEVGDTQDLELKYQPRRVIDASHMLVLPGLINAHTHSGDALFRGLVEDLGLESWLEKLWAAESRFLRPETVGWGAQLAYAEMIRGGTTTALDMFWFPEKLAKAAHSIGFRVITGCVYFDSGLTDGIAVDQRTSLAREFIEQFAHDNLVIPCVQPHGVYTVSPQYLREAADLAREYGVIFSTHASETETEVRNCMEKYGVTPIQHLDRVGALTERTVLAHCVHLADKDFELISRRGVTVAHCPVSNLKLASGIAEVGRMIGSGIKVTLGTDGPVSGNDLNLWYTLRLAAILQKTVMKDPSLLPTQQMLRMVTCEAARALGLDDRIGSLEAGKLADLILVRTDQSHTTPSFDPYSLLVYSAGREDVDSVIIDGQVVLEHAELLTIDENEILQKVRQLEVEIQEFMRGRGG